MLRKLPHDNCLFGAILNKAEHAKKSLQFCTHGTAGQIAGHLDIKACTTAEERLISRKAHANFTQKEATKNLSPESPETLWLVHPDKTPVS